MIKNNKVSKRDQLEKLNMRKQKLDESIKQINNKTRTFNKSLEMSREDRKAFSTELSQKAVQELQKSLMTQFYAKIKGTK